MKLTFFLNYFYIFMFFLLYSDCSDKLVIIPSDPVQEKSLGDRVVLTCRLKNVDPMSNVVNIQWFDPYTGFEILDKTPGTLNAPYIDKSIDLTSKLYIEEMAPKHEGTYICRAVLSGNIEEAKVTLKIMKHIKFVEAEPNQYPMLFTMGTILCKVTGQPSPDVFWKFKGIRLSGGRYSQDFYGLRIDNITEKDTGVYHCCAEIESKGLVECVEINVVVRTPPKIYSFPNVEGIASHEVGLTCKATGYPEAKFEFQKDDAKHVMFSTERYMVDRDGGQLFFMPLIEEDEGEYTCRAFNEVGEDSKKMYFNVVVPPTIYQVLNVTQTENLTTTLICLSFGDPDPKMTFRKEGYSKDYIMGPNEGGRVNLKKTGIGKLEMTFNPVLWDDTANYTCKSKNRGGYHEKNGTVLVNYIPRFSPDMPKVVYNWGGKTRNLTCMVLSQPKPLVEWYRNGRLIQNNETFRIYYINIASNLQVTVREVDEYYIYGTYECRVRNMIGENVAKIEMRRAFLPGAPASARVIRATPTTLEFSIDPPPLQYLYGLKLFGFWVQVENRILEFMPHERIIVDYLRPSNTYDVLTRVRTEIGIGDTYSFKATTADISAPYPLILNSNPKSKFSSEYTVTWERPENGGLPIREYEFRIRKVSVKPNTFIIEKILENWKRRIKSAEISAPTMFYRIQGLESNTYYQLEISALNDVGWSIPNPEFIFKTSPDLLYDDFYYFYYYDNPAIKKSIQFFTFCFLLTISFCFVF